MAIQPLKDALYFGGEPVTRATVYRIVMDTVATSGSPVVSIDVGDTTFSPLSNLNFRQYYWQVSCDLNITAYSPVDSVVIVPSTNVAASVEKKRVFCRFRPNPFNPSTVLNFYNPLCNADIRIFSMMAGWPMQRRTFSMIS